MIILSIFQEINKKKTKNTYVVLALRSVHETTFSHLYIVLALSNTALEPDFTSMIFPFIKQEEVTCSLEE